MELEQIKAIVEMMKDNDLSEFSMEQDGLKIRIKRGPDEFQQTVTLPPLAPLPPVAAPVTVPASAPAPAAPVSAPVATDAKHIVSPMVGTFYLAPAPDAPTYVEVGQQVEAGDTVVILEAMKMENSVNAEKSGVVVSINVAAGDSVSAGDSVVVVE